LQYLFLNDDVKNKIKKNKTIKRDDVGILNFLQLNGINSFTATTKTSPKLHRTHSQETNILPTKGIGCSFKCPVKVAVEESIVNALRIRDQRLNLTFSHEWCVHNRLFDANFDRKFK
jgi:hypothetical protein